MHEGLSENDVSFPPWPLPLVKQDKKIECKEKKKSSC
jgi:hypothetical protein